MKIIGIMIIIVALSTLLFAGLVFGAGAGGTSGSYSLFHVTGGSMEPALSKGSLAIVKSVAVESLTPGDIITYYSHEYNGITTHRIAEIQTVNTDGRPETRFQTRGDANLSADSSLVGAEEIVGQVQGSVSYLGFAIAFLQKNSWIMIGLFSASWIVVGVNMIDP